MSSDIEGHDHAFDAPSAPAPGADRRQDILANLSPDISTPLPDASDRTTTVGDASLHAGEQAGTIEVPRYKAHDAQGREYDISGDPEGCRRFDHHQGENDLGYQGTCGLCSVQDIANQYDLPISENDIVKFAAEHHLCDTHGKPDDQGGTTLETQAQLLADMGIMALPQKGMTVDQLASTFESGHKVIIEVNAGVLFQGVLPDNVCANAVGTNPNEPNHAIVVTGIVRDPQTGAVIGIYVNDSGYPLPAQFISTEHLQAGWANTGGQAVDVIGTVGGRPASMPQAMPGTDPPGDSGPDTPSDGNGSGISAAVVALPLLALGALKVRPKPKPTN
jgi:hypothetical protein